MKTFKKRLQKKFMSKVASGIKDGTITPFYAKRSQEIISHYIDYKYLTEFRPWWYSDEIFAKWGEFDLVAEHKRHFDKWIKEIEFMYNLDFNALSEYYKTMPKRKQNRKPKKEKLPALIRKLLNPEEFTIRNFNRLKKVEGERCFSVKGYDFFIRREGSFWIVSDVMCGMAVLSHERYKKAVQNSRERIEQHFDKYIEFVNKYRIDH